MTTARNRGHPHERGPSRPRRMRRRKPRAFASEPPSRPQRHTMHRRSDNAMPSNASKRSIRPLEIECGPHLLQIRARVHMHLAETLPRRFSTARKIERDTGSHRTDRILAMTGRRRSMTYVHATHSDRAALQVDRVGARRPAPRTIGDFSGRHLAPKEATGERAARRSSQAPT